MDDKWKGDKNQCQHKAQIIGHYRKKLETNAERRLNRKRAEIERSSQTSPTYR